MVGACSPPATRTQESEPQKEENHTDNQCTHGIFAIFWLLILSVDPLNSTRPRHSSRSFFYTRSTSRIAPSPFTSPRTSVPIHTLSCPTQLSRPPRCTPDPKPPPSGHGRALLRQELVGWLEDHVDGGVAERAELLAGEPRIDTGDVESVEARQHPLLCFDGRKGSFG